METIQIHNFGPITDALIEVRNLLVLIGHQASGKSTVSKLIYFFKSLSADFFAKIYTSEKDSIDLLEDLKYPIRVKFYDYFGSTFHLRDFEIIYTFSSGRSITLTLDEDKNLHLELSAEFLPSATEAYLKQVVAQLRSIRREQEQSEDLSKKVALQQQQYDLLQGLLNEVNTLFGTTHKEALYILAGRNATVGYSETFERLLAQDLKKRVEERVPFSSMGQTIDETLMMEFMDRVLKMRSTLQKGGNMEGIIAHATPQQKPWLIKAHRLAFHVLRGQYAQSEYGEKLVFRGGSVYLKDSSSGQQEAIRILQDAFLMISQAKASLRIVEEPEAHLYPEAQKYTIQLLALALNAHPDNQLVITTHSPYTLTVINNLLYASLVATTHPELKEAVDKTVDSKLWIDKDSIAVYRLQNGRSEDIMDREVMMIKAELIDAVSSELNEEYDKLRDLEYAYMTSISER